MVFVFCCGVYAASIYLFFFVSAWPKAFCIILKPTYLYELHRSKIIKIELTHFFVQACIDEKGNDTFPLT